MRVKDLPEISKLSTPEKILLVEDLWDSISADEASIPVPDSHRAELDERHKRYESNQVLSCLLMTSERELKRENDLYLSFST